MRGGQPGGWRRTRGTTAPGNSSRSRARTASSRPRLAVLCPKVSPMRHRCPCSSTQRRSATTPDSRFVVKAVRAGSRCVAQTSAAATSHDSPVASTSSGVTNFRSTCAPTRASDAAWARSASSSTCGSWRHQFVGGQFVDWDDLAGGERDRRVVMTHEHAVAAPSYVELGVVGSDRGGVLNPRHGVVVARALPEPAPVRRDQDVGTTAHGLHASRGRDGEFHHGMQPDRRFPGFVHHGKQRFACIP